MGAQPNSQALATAAAAEDDGTEDYPTALVPARPDGFANRYDRLARQFGAPEVTLFGLQRDCPDPRIRLGAASELLAYRYPKLRAETVTHKGDAGGGGVNIQINIGGPPQPTTVNVTPSPTSDPTVEDLLK